MHPLRKTVVRTPGPSCVENRWILRTVPSSSPSAGLDWSASVISVRPEDTVNDLLAVLRRERAEVGAIARDADDQAAGARGEELGVEARMQMLPMQPGDVPATYADIDRAREKLGYEPTTPIEIGVPKFIAWYREHADLIDKIRAALEPGE